MTDREGDELDRLTARLARKTAELQVLQRVSADINATLDLDEIYNAALRTMGELFESHHATILLLDPGGGTLTVVASRGYENQAVGGRVRVGTGVIGLVAQKRRMLHASNLGQQRAYAAAQRRQMVKSGRGAELADAAPVPGLPNAESQFAIPLLVRDDLIGVFSIESPVRRTFSEHDRALVTIVANQIASAIHNARLYEDRRRAAEELQAVNASLEARVAERTAALQRELRIAEDLLNHARSRVDGPLLGDSAAVRALREAVVREAAGEHPLLLTGPPGAGKETVARAVHAAARRTGAFIFVNCTELQTQSRSPAVPPSSAPRDDAPLLSKMELAAGGTLFLDAVHDFPARLQAQLLERIDAVHPASDRGRPSSFRLIASTTRERPGAGAEAALDRLFTHSIAVPPLADRREDIPAMVDYFVRQHAQQLGKVIDGVSPESMSRLEAYAWPGNVRELRTVLERAAMLAKSSVIDIDEELLDESLAVGSYRLTALIGAGGMGEVWRAKHRLLARPAAVKLIRHDSAGPGGRDQLVRRFEREAQVTAALRSPHTVQLYDFGVNDTGSFYYVMELLDGLDLDKMVKRFGPLPAERVITLVRQACRSLAEAHDYGLVHRDIKPANLFVTRLGREYDFVKVLDFGIVKDRPEGHDATMLSSQGLLQGTPAFMAPELVLDNRPVDGRTDLYALACTAYWAVTGQLVFEGASAAQMLVHHAQTPATPPSLVSELPIPKAFERILMSCLEKNPARRPSSAVDLDDQLARVPVGRPWTPDDARDWWETHAPDLVAKGSA